MKVRFIAFVLPVLFLLIGCSTEAAQKTIKIFHEKLDNNDPDYVCDNLLDGEALQSTPRADWMGLFESIIKGSPVSNRKKQSGFSKKTSNGVTTTALKYTFEKGTTTYYERIVLVDRGKGPNKILFYGLNTDEQKADDYLKEY